jgi:hypothetical protein
MTERSWPHCGEHFSCTVHLDQKRWAEKGNRMFQPTWHYWMCIYPANGRVDFENSWLIKSNFITVSWPGPKLKKKSSINYIWRSMFLNLFLCVEHFGLKKIMWNPMNNKIFYAKAVLYYFFTLRIICLNVSYQILWHIGPSYHQLSN